MIAFFLEKTNKGTGVSRKSGQRDQHINHQRPSWQSGDQTDDWFMALDAAEHGIFIPGAERVFDSHSDNTHDEAENDGGFYQDEEANDDDDSRYEPSDPNEGIW